MGDSTSTMTIDFLRARLLSERSISRSTRQRAEQLAKRVVELEDQLKIVTIQRKKAEKAASEVLAILDAQGNGYLSSEVIDSCSDQEGCQNDRSDDTAKEDDSSAASRTETEISPIPGKNLSWKGNTSKSEVVEKKKIFQFRQRYRSGESSSKPQLGKSCRRLRRIERGSCRGAAADDNGDGAHHDIIRMGGIKCSGRGSSYCSDTNLSIADDISVSNHEDVDSSVGCSLKGERRDPEINFYASGNDIDEQMELAIEKQAELIGQYQEEENAQREWEEKFNQNNCSLLDPSSPGALCRANDCSNDSKNDAIELNCLWHDEEKISKKQLSQVSSDAIDTAELRWETSTTISNKEKKPLTGSKNSDCPLVTTLCSSYSVNSCANGCNSTCAQLEGNSQEFSLPGQTMKSGKFQGFVDHNITNACTDSQSNMIGYPKDVHSSSVFLVQSNSESSKGELSNLHLNLHRPQPEGPEKGLVGVLDALRRAKISLRQELTRTPEQIVPIPRFTIADTQIAFKHNEDLGIPLGCAGLFRLPTDSFSTSGVSKSCYPSASPSLAGPVQACTTFSGTSIGRPYRTFSSMDIGYGKASGKGIDLSINLGIGNPPTNFSRYPAYSMGSSTAASFDGFQKSLVGSNTGRLNVDKYTNYGANNQKMDSLGGFH